MDSITPKIVEPLGPELAKLRSKPDDLRAAAEQFEAIFIQNLLKQARQSKLADDILGSNAENQYTEMLEQERAKSMSKNMSLGIAEALIKQFDSGDGRLSEK
jgi:flagellar protein FlgJ